MRYAALGLAMLGACALGACAAVPSAGPATLRLTADVLALTLTDGTVCRADWAAAGGAGRLAPCGPGFDYVVVIEDRPNPLRQIAEEVVRALDAKGLLAPMAVVTVTADSGRVWSFVSPVPVED